MEWLITLSMFALVSSITPGPNNIMLMSSGANFGFARTLPHLFGVAIGFCFMLLMVGVGIVQLFSTFPVLYSVMTWISVIYLCWLAYKIATAAAPHQGAQNRACPMTFTQALLFQWVNPKAWTMALSAMSVYAPQNTLSAVCLVTLVFGAINLPCISLWTLLGGKIGQLLATPVRLTIFNVAMALLLILSLYPALVMS